MDYQPQPGTVAFRALAHLETLPPGAEMMTSALAEALRVDGSNLTPCLESALKAGRIFRRQRDNHVRSPFWWSLTDHGAKPRTDIRKPAVPEIEIPRFTVPVEAPHTPKGAAGGSCRPATAKETTNGRGAGPAGAAGDDARHAVGPAAPGSLRLALWSDGTLQIQRAGGHEPLLFSAAETQQIVGYLCAMGRAA